VACFGAL